MNDPKGIWQSLDTKGAKMSAAEIRAKAGKLEAEIRRDTIIGFIFTSTITLFGLIGLVTLRQAEPAARIIIAIVVMIVWAGAYWTSVRNKKRLADVQLVTCLEFYRRELQRRRDSFAKPPWILAFVILVALVQFLALARGFNAATGDLLR